MAIAAGTFAFSGCQKEGCTDESATNYDADAKSDDGTCVYDETSTVTLHAHSKMGTADFAYDTEVTNWEGRKMKFTTAQMYVSNFALHNDNGMQEIDDSYLLLKPETMMYELGEVPNDHYHELRFMVGVDSVANHSDPAAWPTEHALSANNPNHAFWSWNSGYIFVKVEGLVDTTAAMNGPMDATFTYHIGMDMLTKDIVLTSHVDVDADVTYNINVDYLQLFNNINLRTDLSSHTMNNMPAAQALSGNIPSAISLQ